MYDFTHSVYISHINNYVIFSSQMLVSLRSFVVKQLLSRIYALPSVKFSGLKLWLCKKIDKYEVWTWCCHGLQGYRYQQVKPPHSGSIGPPCHGPWGLNASAMFSHKTKVFSKERNQNVPNLPTTVFPFFRIFPISWLSQLRKKSQN